MLLICIGLTFGKKAPKRSAGRNIQYFHFFRNKSKLKFDKSVFKRYGNT